MVTMLLRNLPDNLHRRLKIVSAKVKIPMYELVIQAIREKLHNMEDK